LRDARAGFILKNCVDYQYETNKRKIQENHEVLSGKLQTVRQTTSIVYGYVCSGDHRLYLVGNPGALIPKKQVTERRDKRAGFWRAAVTRISCGQTANEPKL
jgi:hypothetical protein